MSDILKFALAKSILNRSRNADAVVEFENGSLFFVEPYETSENFQDFLDYIQEDLKAANNGKHKRIVKYAQTRK